MISIHFKNYIMKTILGIALVFIVWLIMHWNGDFHPLGSVCCIDLSEYSGAGPVTGGVVYEVISDPKDSNSIIIISFDERGSREQLIDPQSPLRFVKIEVNLNTLKTKKEFFTLPKHAFAGLRQNFINAATILPSRGSGKSYSLNSEFMGINFIRISVGGGLNGGFLCLAPSQIGFIRLRLRDNTHDRTIAWRFVFNDNSQYYADRSAFRMDPKNQYATLFEERSKKIYIFKAPFLSM